MRILRLTTLLDFGGQEQQYISFTERPDLLKHAYTFAAIGYGGNAEKILEQRGFKVHIFNRKFPIKNLSNIWFLYKFIKENDFDIVHTAAGEANFHGVLAAKLAGVRTIFAEEIGIPNHSFLAKKVFHIVYHFADKIVCVSQAVKNHLVKIKEIPSKKGTVVYNPVTFPKKYEKTEKSDFNIVYVGRLEKVKNIETLIKAFSKIEISNVTLTIVGDGRERDYLEKLVGELNISNRIFFKGFSKEPSKYLSNADLFVLPSYSEGFGIAAVEAMFLKIPVLCSKVGGIPEFIIDGKNGWLFNPNDEQDLVEKLDSLIASDYISISKVAEEGYKSVIDRFTTEKYINNLEELYSNEYK